MSRACFVTGASFAVKLKNIMSNIGKNKFVLALVLISGVFFVQSCTKQTDDYKIREIVNSVADAASKKDIKTIKKHVSVDYRDKKGNDYNGLRGMLAYYFLQHPRISVFITEVSVEISAGSAEVFIRTVLTSGEDVKSLSDILPTNMSIYEFIIDFKKEGDNWVITGADWYRAGERSVK
ncbi:MAG TPA: hypothetical protein VII00_08015 [bacterium]